MADLLTSSFMPHGHCFLWRADILWLNVTSDLVIAISYFSIPFALRRFVQRRKDLRFTWIFYLFAAFILLCGVTHLIGVWTVWSGRYGIQGVAKAATALVSLTTAVAVWPLLPHALSIPSAATLQRTLEEKTLALVNVNERLARSNADLLQKTQILSGILKNASTAIWLNRACGQYELVNPAWVSVTGISEEVATEMGSKVQSPLATPDLDAEVLKSGETKTIELLAERHGRRATFLITRYLIDEPVQDLRLGGIATDVSALRQAEIAARKAIRELKSTNEYLQQFASVASHDLRSPLHKVKAFISILGRRMEGRLSEKDRELFDKVMEAVGRMGTLIDSLRSLAEVRISPDRLQTVSLGSLVDDAASELSAELNASGGRVVCSATATRLTVDPQLFRQLFVNLISNSLKYRRIEVPLEVEILIKTTSPDGSTTLEVSDNGIGFAESDCERIFEPLKRLHRDPDRSGLGIGLALCRRIVNAHGGTISARGVPGEGATFTIEVIDAATHFEAEGPESTG